MIIACVLFCDLILQKGLKHDQKTKIVYIIFLFTYFQYIIGYRDGGAALGSKHGKIGDAAVILVCSGLLW